MSMPIAKKYPTSLTQSMKMEAGANAGGFDKRKKN
jgi:hypothetical protein